MGAVIYDVVHGAMTPKVADTCVNALGKMQKTYELEQKYGKNVGGKKVIYLDADEPLDDGVTSSAS